MFSGIIEAAVELKAIRREGGLAVLGLDLSALPDAETIKLGDSVAVNGCCLTVARLNGLVAEFEAIPETLKLTNLGALKTGDGVNLERALKAGARLDGHMVQGHVDCVAPVGGIERVGDDVRIRINCGREFASQCVLKGSVCINGVSLTIAELGEADLTVAIIPHTLAITNLSALSAGSPVNLEADVIGKYVALHVERILGKEPKGANLDLLKRAGFA